MARKVIRLGPGECSDIETGARFFAAVAFPGKNEESARVDAVRAWAGSYLHEVNKVDGRTESFADARLNEFVALPPRWCRAKVRTVMRRFRDRADAARAVRPWMREILNDPHPPVDGIRKFTQRQIALYLCDNDPEKAANFQKRVWRPCRPVIHVSVAYDLVLSWHGGRQTEFGVDLASAEFLEKIVGIANLVQPLISADRRFGIRMEEQITLEWVV